MVGTRNKSKNTRKDPAVRVTLSMRDRPNNMVRHTNTQNINPPVMVPPKVDVSSPTPVLPLPPILPLPQGGARNETVQERNTLTESPEVMNVYPTTPVHVETNNYALARPRQQPSPYQPNDHSSNHSIDQASRQPNIVTTQQPISLDSD